MTATPPMLKIRKIFHSVHILFVILCEDECTCVTKGNTASGHHAHIEQLKWSCANVVANP